LSEVKWRAELCECPVPLALRPPSLDDLVVAAIRAIRSTPLKGNQDLLATVRHPVVELNETPNI